MLIAVPLRLLPGDDVRLRLEALTRERGWPAAFVLSGIGSLRVAALRLAGAHAPLILCEPVEVLTLAGSLSSDGAHLHISIARADGSVLGGHVCAGCEVHTTLELLVAVLPDHRFSRVADAATGYAELRIGEAPAGAPGPARRPL